MDLPFRYRLRVRYGECDAQKVVFNPRYADYVDAALIEFMRVVGCGVNQLMQRGLDMQVVKLTLEWRGSARFDDVVETHIRTLDIGNSSLRVEFDMRRAADDKPLCRAEGVYVMVASETWEKTRVPDDIRAAFMEGGQGMLVDQSGGIVA